MRSTRYREAVPCPQCGAQLDAATDADRDGSAMPTPGALAVCWDCAAMLVYTDPPHLRPITEEEIDALEPDEALRLLALVTVIGRRRSGPSGYYRRPFTP